MKVTLLGAAGTVTGSRYLVEAGDRRVLLDCGLFQGLKELRLRNREPFPVDPASLDAVVLTHAHLDHTGYLPVLVRSGFRGPVYCTPATAALCGVFLPDSGRLQEEDTLHAAAGGYSRHTAPEPLYTEADAVRALEYLAPVHLDEEIRLGDALNARLRTAGHLLGATTVQFEADGVTALFSGDLGRPSDPILYPPRPVPSGADLLVVESTYGDRLHDDVDPAERLGEVIRETLRRGGSVLIPAFAEGRAQAVLYYLHQLKVAGRIPEGLPIFLDSPMAEQASQVFLTHRTETRLSADLARSVARTAIPTPTASASKRIGRMTEPRVIVAASGMATGGRVLHHLARMAPDLRNAIVFAGYQAVGTRGADLVAGAQSVKIHGQPVPVLARVVSLPNTSGHADAGEILAWLRAVSPGAAPRQVLITHGEPAAAEALRRTIAAELGWSCRAVRDGESVPVVSRGAPTEYLFPTAVSAGGGAGRPPW